MTKDEIRDDVKKLFIERFGEDIFARLENEPEPFKPAAAANRLVDDLDSLDHVEFIMTIEDHFSIEIDDVSAQLIRTIDDAVNAVHTRLSNPRHGAR